ncbi:MAG: ArnT family glycosyltransferase [Hyphomicrobiales bacterium]
MKAKFGKAIFWLIIISTVIRAVLAYLIEFGNDEVYYWTYALYPSLSHFDHPPMVGLMIQLFSLNLHFDSEFAIRLPSIILGTFDTYLIYLIGKRIKDGLTGFYAALLYTASLYGFIIVGVFILPDTPQIFFMLLAVYLFLKTLPVDHIERKHRGVLCLAGLITGLGMISKYTAIYVWVGILLYIIFFDRRWLKELTLYVSGIISIVCLTPVLLWNWENDFISFTFHGERVDVFKAGLDLDYFFTEIGGEFLYNNPVVYILIIIMIVAIIRGKKFVDGKYVKMLMCIGLPIILTFIGFSLFRKTLPHWTAPGFVMLIPLTGAWLSDKWRRNLKPVMMPWPLKIALAFTIVTFLVGVAQINYGIVKLDNTKKYEKLGEDDFSLDMYGWDQVEKQFAQIRKVEVDSMNISPDAPIIGNKWFPLAHIDYYVARPLDMKVLALGHLVDIHKYAWITEERGGLHKGMDAWYITNSRNYTNPRSIYKSYFNSINIVDTIQIERSGKIEARAFVYLMKDLKKLPKPFHISKR